MLCSLNKDANHSKQQQKPFPIKLYFNNCGREGGFYNFFSVINFTFKLLNPYRCVFHVSCYSTFVLFLFFNFIYIYIYMCMCMYLHMCVDGLCMCVYIYVYMYIFIYIHICFHKILF